MILEHPTRDRVKSVAYQQRDKDAKKPYSSSTLGAFTNPHAFSDRYGSAPTNLVDAMEQERLMILKEQQQDVSEGDESVTDDASSSSSSSSMTDEQAAAAGTHDCIILGSVASQHSTLCMWAACVCVCVCVYVCVRVCACVLLCV